MNRSRLAAVPFVVAIHALIAVALAMPRVMTHIEPKPLMVSMIATTPAKPLPPPPPAAPSIDVAVTPVPAAIAPQLVVAQPPTTTAISVAAAPPPANVTSPAQALVEARFDVDYLQNPPPAYPAASRRMREEGLVMLKVKVRNDGTVDAVLVHHSSGSSRLDDAALVTVKRWKFVPAQRGNEAVESWVLVPIEFKLKPRNA